MTIKSKLKTITNYEVYSQFKQHINLTLVTLLLDSLCRAKSFEQDVIAGLFVQVTHNSEAFAVLCKRDNRYSETEIAIKISLIKQNHRDILTAIKNINKNGLKSLIAEQGLEISDEFISLLKKLETNKPSHEILQAIEKIFSRLTFRSKHHG